MRIDECTPNLITIFDKDTWNGNLDEVRKQLEATKNLLNGLVTDLDPDHDEDRIVQLTLWLLPILLPRLQKNLKK